MNAVVGHFMQCLDAPTAVAVHEYRSEQRHAETLAAIRDRDRVDERLAALPPSVRDALNRVRAAHDGHFGQLLGFVESSVATPEVSVDSLLTPPTPWLADLSGGAVVVLAEFAAAYELPRQAGSLLERAATLGFDASRNLGRAALLAKQSGDQRRASELAERSAANSDDAFSRAVRAMVADDAAGAIAALHGHTDQDAIAAGILAVAFLQEGREDEAIALLRPVTAERPDLLGHEVLLASILAVRAASGRSPARAADLIEATDRALRVRDARRRWQGPSADGVAVACQAAAADYDTEGIMRLGCVPPEGEATAAESTDGRVRHFVARGLLALGRLEGAQAIAAEIGDQFLQSLVAAKACLVDKPPRLDEGRVLVAAAWPLAPDDALRFDVLLTAAGLGMDPLPGGDWIESLTEESRALLAAQKDDALGHSDRAIAGLRPYEGTSEQCAVMLAHVLVRRGDIDEAVEELRHTADRFERPQLLIDAAALLMTPGRLDEAHSILLDVLARLGRRTPGRRLAQEMLLELCRLRRDWQGMERQAQALLAEFGPGDDFRWALVGARWNQGRAEDAWRAAVSDPPLEPRDGATAALWALLHCQFAPGRATVLRVADLIEEHIEEQELATAMVQALVTLSAPEAPQPDEQARWNAALSRFLERYPDSPKLRRVDVGEDLDELYSFMRATLEPSAPLYEDFKSKVAAGIAPYGFLSMVGGKPYTAAFLHRAAGCLLIYHADRAVAASERTAADAALDQPVVVDPSALVVASFTDGLWAQVQAALGPMSITEAAYRDAVAARAFSAQGDGMSVGWNPAAERFEVSQLDPAELVELRRRAASVEERASGLRHVGWTSQTALDHDPESGRRFDDDPRLWAWLATVDYAKAKGFALLCDDCSLRDFSRSVGVPTFGSASLMEALNTAGRLDGEALERMFECGRSEFCVDLPGAEPLVEHARRTGFERGSAALAISRPALWRDDVMACDRSFVSIVEGAAVGHRQYLPAWLYAAIKGAAAVKIPASAPRIAASLLLQVIDRVSPSPTLFSQLVAAAREALAGQTDVELAFVFRALVTTLRTKVGEHATSYVLSLASALPAEDRQLARSVVFDIAGVDLGLS